MRIAVLFALPLISTAVVFGDTSFKGTVADVDGAVIPGAMILVHWGSSGSSVGLTTIVGIQKDLTMTADKDGKFRADLPPGFYDVFVSVMAFTPTCRKIRIMPNAPEELTLRMDVDPLVTSEMGNRVTPAR